MNALTEFLKTSYTAYHACKNAKEFLLENGFQQLYEDDDWAICEEGKYFVERDGSSLIAFTVGLLDDFRYKIVASHTDSPALKLKENPFSQSGAYVTLNVEKYGGGIWYSFFDRPLKIAGRAVTNKNGTLQAELVTSSYQVTIPSVAIHMNRTVNDSFGVNPQIDLQPLYSLKDEPVSLDDLILDEEATLVSHDLFVVNADMPYSFGKNDEFLASPRLDNLANVFASLEALVNGEDRSGICIAAMLDNEEVGSLTAQGADGDFLETVMKRIAYSLRLDENEYYKTLASSFLLSADNAHALHPNHPEKSDPTNKTLLGGDIVIKSHANKAYTTDALSSAIIKTIWDNAGVSYQAFFNRSDMQSGSTLGAASTRHVSMKAADIGIAQLAMHSACESFAKADYLEMKKGLTAFYEANILFSKDGVIIR